ncbi:hypothetical protein [Demequina rhizosphaerae]|uniref:hypothetical protein n=1 Tax=Demequina rhizosphaerae TaxID=1638985 RepID=UPI000780C187|nr:hypothetical protein [Demequina rhizosphaerae]
MTQFGVLPEDPRARRVVIALDQVDFDGIDMGDSRNLLRRRDVAVVNVEDQQNLAGSLAGELIDAGVLTAGAVLAQNPYRNDDYLPVQESDQAFAIEKFMVVSHICQLLGAKSIEVLKVDEQERNSHWSAGAGVGVKGTKVDATVKGEKAASLARRIELHDQFDGAEPNIELAIAALRSRNLTRERDLVALIDGRTGDHNLLKKRTLEMDLSTESRRLLDIALEVNVPVLPVSAKAALEKASSEKSHYLVRYVVDF